MENDLEQFADPIRPEVIEDGSDEGGDKEPEAERQFFESEGMRESIDRENEDEFLGRERLIAEMQKAEKESFERNPSKIRRAFLAVTAAASLMMGATGLESRAYAMEAEDAVVSAEKEERSPEETRLLAELEKSGYSEEESGEFVDFARERGVPMDDFFIVMANKDNNSDTLLLFKSYAVAYDAVAGDKLSGDAKERFIAHVLPALKNGYVDVIKMLPDEMKGSEALYDGKNDAYKDTDIDLNSSGDKAIAIHELMHVAQDSMELAQEREDSEHEAYKAGTEYTMRESNVIQKNEEGEMVFGKKIVIGEVRTEYEKLIIFEYALRNAEAGKNDRNSIVADGVECAELSNDEAIAFYKEQIDVLNEFARMVWASSTDMGSIVSGKMINTEETIIKDGLKRKKGQ